MRKGLWVGLILTLFAMGSRSQSQPTLIRLAISEWPPFTGLLLPNEGISTYVATTVAKAAGFRLVSASFDWTKAVEKGDKSPDFEGYFPQYQSKEREAACHLSQAIGTSVLGVASLKKSNVKWTKIRDLQTYRLGVVKGYQNGDELDEAIKEKRQPIEVGSSDAANVAKLRAGKIRAIVIDKNVLDFMLYKTKDGASVSFNPTPWPNAVCTFASSARHRA